MQKEVVNLVSEMGKSGGYLLIIERRTGGVLYFPKSVDVTDKLIQKYNVTFAKKPAAKKKK